MRAVIAFFLFLFQLHPVQACTLQGSERCLAHLPFGIHAAQNPIRASEGCLVLFGYCRGLLALRAARCLQETFLEVEKQVQWVGAAIECLADSFSGHVLPIPMEGLT